MAISLLVLGCDAPAPPPSAVVNDGTAWGCSQVHRALRRWQGNNSEVDECGPDVTGMLELTPMGNDLLLARRRFSAFDDLWSLGSDGSVLGATPTPAAQIPDAGTAGFTLLSGPAPKVFVYDPRSPIWYLQTLDHGIGPVDSFSAPAQGTWPPPWGHQILGIEDGHLLDRDLSDGSTRVWSFVVGPDGTSDLTGPTAPAGEPRESFRRGHRLAYLGPNRLLEWMPRRCGAGVDPASADCAGSDFTVWGYSLDAGAPFDPQPVSSDYWRDVGAESDLVGDGVHLFLWTRASGRLRAYTLDPAAPDPLSLALLSADTTPPNNGLRSQDWHPPTQAPAIQHLVLILQDGRSFDSYFGRYCQGTALPDGKPLDCENDGPACCEAIPALAANGAACLDLEAEASYKPGDGPECMSAKMDGGTMNGFAIAHPPDMCGGPQDVACAATGAAGGAVARYYHGLAGTGALADRFFQTYAFADGIAGSTALPSDLANFLYLPGARFVLDPATLIDKPILTKELVREQVSWAFYAGHKYLERGVVFGLPLYYDPDWSPYRSLEEGELEHDIAAGELPAVSVVVPDRGDPLRSETPGQPFDPGIQFTAGLVDAITASRYGDDTLVLVAYLTAGGFYDHVRPPEAPPLNGDASSGARATATRVHYGPRVPLMALGRFARPHTVSHVQLEMSSITTFIEWNWLNNNALKGQRETQDIRRYRDTFTNNLGSLIEPAAAGAPVPTTR